MRHKITDDMTSRLSALSPEEMEELLYDYESDDKLETDELSDSDIDGGYTVHPSDEISDSESSEEAPVRPFCQKTAKHAQGLATKWRCSPNCSSVTHSPAIPSA